MHHKAFDNLDEIIINMNQETRKRLEALANGVDPETGELLNQESPYNQPEAIRAMWKALDECKNTTNEVRPSKQETEDKQAKNKANGLPKNAGVRWTDEEKKQLVDNYNSKISIEDISKLHGRTDGAIIVALAKLGIIVFEYSLKVNDFTKENLIKIYSLFSKDFFFKGTSSLDFSPANGLFTKEVRRAISPKVSSLSTSDFIDNYITRGHMDIWTENTVVPWTLDLIKVLLIKWLDGDVIRYCEEHSILIETSKEYVNFFEFKNDYNRVTHRYYDEVIPGSIISFFDNLLGNETIPLPLKFEALESNIFEGYNSCFIQDEIFEIKDFISEFDSELQYLVTEDYPGYFSVNAKYLKSTILLEKYKRHFDWKYVTKNMPVSWSLPLMVKFKNVIDWDYLTQNMPLNWSLSLMVKFKDVLNWEYLTKNMPLDWSFSLVVNLKDVLDWKYLIQNSPSD